MIFLDTAQVYRNEADLGKALEVLLPKHNLKRENVFIITKIGMHNQGEKCGESLVASLNDLRTEYVDLVLIHWPGVKGLKPNDAKNFELRKRTYLELEKMNSEGKTRLLGVSNYTIRHLNELFTYCTIRPHLLQVILCF